ncbi:MAG: CoA transferase [Dehalococcoidia bacterium]|nr:CoA transferase [Dehalococcoidia bacterium]
MPRPLEKIRVMDLTQVFAGPTCTRILADLGAEVIRLESPNRMDITRALLHVDNDGKDVPWERALYFTIRNAGKKEIVVDLNRERGRELLRGLIAQSDVVAESFTPRVMRAFELDYEHVRAIKPDIIMISLSGYGQSGPYADWSAYGMGLEPASGVSQLTGYPGGPPMRSGLSFTDPYSGFIGAGAVLAALHYRRRTGKGQFIDLSEQEAAIPLAGAALMDFAMNGRLPERMGNRSPHAAPQGCYRCRGDAFGKLSAGDDWLVISIETDAEWEAFCRAAGHAEWAADERFADVLGRRRHHDELDKLIESWTREQDHYDAFHLLQRAGVKAAPVLNGKEILRDPHFKERRHFDVVDQPHQGRRPVQRHLGAEFGHEAVAAGDDFEASAQGPAPGFGEHNREVLGGLLGLSDDELRDLESQGVIATKPKLPVPPSIVSQALQLPYDRFLEAGILRAIEPDYKKQLGLE